MAVERRIVVTALLVLATALVGFSLLFDRGGTCMRREEVQVLPFVAAALCVTVAVGFGRGRRRWIWGAVIGLSIFAALWVEWAGRRLECLN